MGVNILNKLFGSSPKDVTTQCPNCNFVIHKEIKSKSKCPNCHKDIYVRTHYKTGKQLFLTEKDKNNFDDERSSYYFSKKWLTKMNEIGISDDEIKATTKELSQKWGPGHPNFNDLAWAIFNKQVVKIGRKLNPRNGYFDMKWLYFNWAMFAYEIDRNPNPLLKEAWKWEVLGYKVSKVVKQVQILSGNGCAWCRELNGKKYSIEEALKGHVLPNKDCSFKLNEESKYTWCRCIWQAVV